MWDAAGLRGVRRQPHGRDHRARDRREDRVALRPGAACEAAFRIHKSDLQLRPVWHQKEDRVQAHILVCFLAYVLWKMLAMRCRRAGLGDEPRKVLDELARIRTVDVVLHTDTGLLLRRRCVSQPTDHQAILLHRLGLTLPQHLPQTDQITTACSGNLT